MAKTGFDLASILGDVSKLDTGLQPDGREQLEYIDLSIIDPDPNNFYAMTDIEELAANIELLGLQQPLRVRPNPDKPGRLIIVSGHRRRAALELLVGDGKSQFAQVPCIREAGDQSAALQELRLIYANSDTRRMTSAEISKQAERVEALLYQLKEEGMDFPGRMRDHVAEACKVSKSKLARLKVIRDNLDKGLKKHYEKGDLSESAAYALAHQPVKIQRAVFDYKCTGKNDTKYLRDWEVDSFAKVYTAITEQKCKKCESGKCEHGAALLGKIYDDSYGYKPCEYAKCCNKCEKLASCKVACPKLADRVKKLKADKKEAARQEELAKEVRERPYVEQITALWQRFGTARQQAKKSVKAYKKAIDVYYYGDSDDKEYEALETAQGKISPRTSLPYGYNTTLTEINRFILAADCLECSLDYLLCRTDEPEINKSGTSSAAPTWNTGLPEASGHYWVKFDCDGMEVTDDLFYDVLLGQWRRPVIGPFEDGEVLAWYPLPGD